MGMLEGVAVSFWGAMFLGTASGAVQLAPSPRHPGPVHLLSHSNGGCFTTEGG